MTTPVPELQVSDTALAKIAAHAAVTTAGVARLQPALTRVLHRAATSAARGHLPGPPVPASPADPAAVTIDHPPGPVVVMVRIIATGQPPVLATVTTLQHRITAAVHELTGQAADVRIQVAAFDPAGTALPPA